MERFDRFVPRNFVTAAEASATRSRYQLLLGGVETAAEVAKAKRVVREVGEALKDSIAEGRRSLERSYFKRYLLNYARWENEVVYWNYCGPSISSAQRPAYDAKRVMVNKGMLDAHWNVVVKQIADKIEGIEMMQKILRDLQLLGI